jgi:hypothetical protein
MAVHVALRERGRFATLLNSLLQAAGRWGAGPRPDPRNLRTWRQFVLGVLVQRSARLITVAQATVEGRRAQSVRTAAAALGYLLSEAQWALRPFSTRVLLAAVAQLDPACFVTYRGHVLLVLDPTEYPKRSRGSGKRGRQMQHAGRVRKAAKGQPKAAKRQAVRGKAAAAPGQPAKRAVATTFGYVDIWAGLVLKGQQFFPLARHLYSNHHPRLQSQNRVEDAVLGMARGLVRRLGLRALVLGDRGLGRKELLIRLAQQEQPFVFRLDPDILVGPPGTIPAQRLDAYLAQQPTLGHAVWQRGGEPALPCTVRAARGTIRYSRSGRQADYTEATLQFVELRPRDPAHDSLVLATTFPCATLADAVGLARVYAFRWSIETAFETLKGWGLDRFMVRSWQAIDRLLWIFTLAYVLLLLAQRSPALKRFRAQATVLLKRRAVLGRRLTVGKLAQAIGLDFTRHSRAWARLWFL